MSYFVINTDDFEKLDHANDFVKTPFLIGDILGLSLRIKGYSYFFEGLCMKCKKKKGKSPETTLTLRNILGTVGIEFSVHIFITGFFQCV